MTKIDMSRFLRDPDMVLHSLQMMAADVAAIRRLLERQSAPGSAIRNSRPESTAVADGRQGLVDLDRAFSGPTNPELLVKLQNAVLPPMRYPADFDGVHHVAGPGDRNGAR